MKNYQEVPSSAIDSITIDSDTNQVVVKYKSSAKSYTYSTEDAESFDTQLLAEFWGYLSGSIHQSKCQSRHFDFASRLTLSHP